MVKKRLTGIALAIGLVVAVAACEPMPASGRFVTAQYTEAQITAVMNQQYATAVQMNGQSVVLRLDLYYPPDDGPGPRPAVIAVHGGGFTGGNRGQMAATAISYARLGFVSATISYRLEPGVSLDNPGPYLTAVQNAIDDGMESVRWIRSQAATYNIDTTRIAMVGSSAGGGIALGVGMHEDPTPSGPLAAYSPRIGVAVSTGATLTAGIDLGIIVADPADTPSMLFHYETDTVTGWTAAYASENCTALIEQTVDCRVIVNAGSGHTVGLGASGTRWTGTIGPFIWDKLALWQVD